MGSEQQPDAQLPDVELARRARAGETDALEVLLRRYQDPTYGFCLRWLGEQRHAGEAARDALVSFAEQLKRSNVPARVLVYQCAVAACEERSSARTIEKAGLDEGDEARLRAALSELDVSELSVLLLRDLVGLDLDQIAEVLALSRGSARSRLQRARLKLGRLLETRIDV